MLSDDGFGCCEEDLGRVWMSFGSSCIQTLLINRYCGRQFNDTYRIWYHMLRAKSYLIPHAKNQIASVPTCYAHGSSPEAHGSLLEAHGSWLRVRVPGSDIIANCRIFKFSNFQFSNVQISNFKFSIFQFFKFASFQFANLTIYNLPICNVPTFTNFKGSNIQNLNFKFHVFISHFSNC